MYAVRTIYADRVIATRWFHSLEAAKTHAARLKLAVIYDPNGRVIKS